MTSNRRFSIGEFLTYTTGWGVLCVVFTKDNPHPFTIIPVLLLPGFLIGGPLGIALGGRRWFWTAGRLGMYIWIGLGIIIPMINASR